jgi:hypothetical protein
MQISISTPDIVDMSKYMVPSLDLGVSKQKKAADVAEKAQTSTYAEPTEKKPEKDLLRTIEPK